MKTPKLKPCHCGGKAWWRMRTKGLSLEGVMYQIGCNRLKCNNQQSEWFLDEEAAIAAWNRRAKPRKKK